MKDLRKEAEEEGPEVVVEAEVEEDIKEDLDLATRRAEEETREDILVTETVIDVVVEDTGAAPAPTVTRTGLGDDGEVKQVILILTVISLRVEIVLNLLIKLLKRLCSQQ